MPKKLSETHNDVKIKSIYRKPHKDDNLPDNCKENGIIMNHIHVMDVQISKAASTKP